MKEGSRIVKYNVEFWKLVARVDWNESALTARYFSGLPLRLRTEVMRGGKPTNLLVCVSRLRKADDIHWIATRRDPERKPELRNLREKRL